MLGYGRDESAPTPGGVFCGVSWVGVTLLVNRSQHYRNPSAGVGVRFIVPAYRKIHTKWGWEMHVR